MNDIGNYVKHARYWDWGGHDRTVEHEHWYTNAKKYGNSVLIPMCALGETGVYMAERGMTVTAFDITHEMISEGKKRFGGVSGLQFFEGDVRGFRLDIPPADFCFCTDFGHLHTIEDIKMALVCIGAHLREGAGLVIEAELRMPGAPSRHYPQETFYPQEQVYPGLKVWKTGDTRIDGETGRTYISQVFYTEDEQGRVESFDHAFYLQSYTLEEWRAAFRECGFEVAGEYSSRDMSPRLDGDGFCIFETRRVKTHEHH